MENKDANKNKGIKCKQFLKFVNENKHPIVCFVGQLQPEKRKNEYASDEESEKNK